jgi:hypothetical protein
MITTTFEYPGQALTMQRVAPGNVLFGVSPYVYQYKEFTFLYTGGGTLVPLVGNWIKGATTACQAKIISIGTLTGGTWAGGDAAGTLRIASVHGTATSEVTYFNATENVSVVATADDLTIASAFKECTDDYYGMNQLAKAMLVNVITNAALVTWDGSRPDQTQLTGVTMNAGSSILLKDINSIKNFKFIDRVSGSASVVELVCYF